MFMKPWLVLFLLSVCSAAQGKSVNPSIIQAIDSANNPAYFDSVGDYKKAEQIYAKLWKEKPSVETAAKYAGFLLNKMRSPDSALQIIRAVRQIKSGMTYDTAFARMAAECYLTLDSLNAAEKELLGLERLAANDTSLLSEIRFMHGEIFACKHLWKSAQAKWEQCIELRNGIKINDALRLTDLFQSLGHDTEALGIYWKAYLSAKRGEFAAAARSASDIINKLYGGTRTFIAIEVAEWRIKGGNLAAGINLLKDERERCVDCDLILIALARTYLAARDTAKTIETYENLLLDYPESVFFDEAKAYIGKLKK